jgi:hypothetical protein
VEEQNVSKCWRFDHKMGKVHSVLRFQKQKGVDLLFHELTCGCQLQDLGLLVDEKMRQP